MNQWETLADQATIDQTISFLKQRNINAEVVNTAAEALERIKELIPAGSEVMTGGSTTLDEIEFTDILKSKNHPWQNLKDEILAEKDEFKQAELRRRSVTSEYFLGSVHAVSKNGEVVVASATGSQLPSYTFSSPHVIWIVGIQKITSNLDEAIKRVREYTLPLEDQRMKNLGYPGSMIGKMVIFEKEFVEGRITLIFVKEKLGF